jgi:hypothetical protein
LKEHAHWPGAKICKEALAVAGRWICWALCLGGLALQAQTVEVYVYPASEVKLGQELTFSGSLNGFSNLYGYYDYGSSIDLSVSVIDYSWGGTLVYYSQSGLANGSTWAFSSAGWMTGNFTVLAMAWQNGQYTYDTGSLVVVDMDTFTGPLVTCLGHPFTYYSQTVPAGYEHMVVYSGDDIVSPPYGLSVVILHNSIGLFNLYAQVANALPRENFGARLTHDPTVRRGRRHGHP